jgi:predicted phage terminase large subunit-like protein
MRPRHRSLRSANERFNKRIEREYGIKTAPPPSDTPVQDSWRKRQAEEAAPEVPQDGVVRIGPQPGPQEMFLSTEADIAVYGGAAGGGKTWALLLEPIRAVQNPKFAGVIFRRTYPMIRNEGGLWDESVDLYKMLGATPKLSDFEWQFPSGATIRFAHMQHENNKLDWQGSQIPFIGFDELTHFSESQFFYVALSRGRSMSGIKPYVRATTNPDASSWVKKFLAPWIDRTSPIKAKSGEVMYMVREGGQVTWYRSREDLPEEHKDAVSVTFVSASVYDNEIMLKENPGYLARLRALPPVERARLLDGDWDVVPSAGKVFNKTWAKLTDDLPARPQLEIIRSYGTRQEVEYVENPNAPFRMVRFWDFAGTEKEISSRDPDYTVGVKMVLAGDRVYVVDVVRGQFAAGAVDGIVLETARADGRNVAVRWEVEGGSAGKMVAAGLVKTLLGFDAQGARPRGTKLTRFKPFAKAARGGLVYVLKGAFTEDYLAELHHFPDKEWKKDQVDATSGAFTYLTMQATEVFEGPDLFTDDPTEAASTMTDQNIARVVKSYEANTPVQTASNPVVVQDPYSVRSSWSSWTRNTGIESLKEWLG